MSDKDKIKFLDHLLKHLYQRQGSIQRTHCSTCKLLHSYIHYDVEPVHFPVTTPDDILKMIREQS